MKKGLCEGGGGGGGGRELQSRERVCEDHAATV